MKVKNAHKNLVEDVKKTLTDPIYNVTHNFSLENEYRPTEDYFNS